MWITILYGFLLICFHVIPWNGIGWSDRTGMDKVSTLKLALTSRLTFYFEILTKASLENQGTVGFAKLGGMLRYLAHESSKNVIEGPTLPQARLYLPAELFFHYPLPENRLAENYLNQLREFSQNMDRLGVQFLLVPIPTKIAVERHWLSEKIRLYRPDVLPTTKESFGENYQAIINDNPNKTVDLYRKYLSYLKSFPDADLFIPTDSHWSSLGISVAATAILEKLGGFKELEIYQFGLLAPRLFDMNIFMGLPEFFVQLRSELKWALPFYLLKPISPIPHLGIRRIVVFGTSMSEAGHGQGWGLGEVLAHALGVEVYQPGRGLGMTMGSINKFVQSGLRLKKGDLVLLEFLARAGWESYERFPRLDREYEFEKLIGEAKHFQDSRGDRCVRECNEKISTPFI